MNTKDFQALILEGPTRENLAYGSLAVPSLDIQLQMLLINVLLIKMFIIKKIMLILRGLKLPFD